MVPDRQKRWKYIGAAAGGLLLFALIFAVQYFAGAHSAGLGAYPDEPSHFVAGVMVRDYLRDGASKPPMAFARDYYFHRPYFAIGYWPPIFYGIEALWYYAAGLGRAQILLFVGTVAGLLATSVFLAGWRISGFWRGLAAAVIFCLLPPVQWSSCLVMTDVMVGLFSFWAVLAASAMFTRLDARSSVLLGVCAAFAILTKYLGGFVVLTPIFFVVLTRRWRVLRVPPLWLSAIVVIVLCAPWVLYTRRFATAGFNTFQQEGFPQRVAHWAVAVMNNVSWPLAVLFAAALVYALTQWPKLSVAQQMLALQPVSAVAFLLFTPVGIETRYLVPAFAAWVLTMLTALGLFEKRWNLQPSRVNACLAAGVLIYGAWAWRRFPPLPPNNSAAVVRWITERTEFKDAAVLVPTSMEGPMIAEFTLNESENASRILVRPNKLLARVDWLGVNYEPVYGSAEELERALINGPIRIIVLAKNASRVRPHDTMLREAIRAAGTPWKLRKTVRGANDQEAFEIYIRDPAADVNPEALTQLLRQQLRSTSRHED